MKRLVNMPDEIAEFENVLLCGKQSVCFPSPVLEVIIVLHNDKYYIKARLCGGVICPGLEIPSARALYDTEDEVRDMLIKAAGQDDYYHFDVEEVIDTLKGDNQ